LIRKTAITIALEQIEYEERIIAANGFISRDLFSISDTRPTFYMIGSMGLASSIGLGIALKDPEKRVFVFDGDGNILMNLGSLTTIGSLKPKNLIHVVFDNSVHESTGSQPTNTLQSRRPDRTLFLRAWVRTQTCCYFPCRRRGPRSPFR